MKKQLIGVAAAAVLLSPLGFEVGSISAEELTKKEMKINNGIHKVVDLDNSTFSQNALSKSELSKKKDEIKQLKSFINKNGNVLTLKGEKIKKNKLFKELLKGKDVPVLLEKSSDLPDIAETEKSGKKLKQDISTNKDKTNSITTGVTVYNLNGKLHTSYDVITLPEGYTLNDIDPKKLKQIMKPKSKEKIEKFKDKVKKADKKDKESKLTQDFTTQSLSAASSGGFLGTVEKNENIFGTFQHNGSTYNELVGQYNLSYLIYSNGDAEADNDYMTVKTEGQFSTGRAVYNDPYHLIETGAFQSDFENVYERDDLIDYGPDTRISDLSGETVNFTIGYPFSVSTQWQYDGEAGTALKAVGDRNDDFYYQLLYDTDYDDLAEDLNSVSYSNSVMYKLNWSDVPDDMSRYMILTARNIFRYHPVGESHSEDKWAYGSDDVLYYSYD